MPVFIQARPILDVGNICRESWLAFCEAEAAVLKRPWKTGDFPWSVPAASPVAKIQIPACFHPPSKRTVEVRGRLHVSSHDSVMCDARLERADMRDCGEKRTGRGFETPPNPLTD